MEEGRSRVGVDLEEARYMFVKHSDFTEERTWLWWWAVGDVDVVENIASGYARTKAEAQRCAVAVATAMGWVKP